jgi:glycosyltransferase involved in cell wall biosynthesis
MELSVCYIVKNEAQFLEASLQSVQSLANEIILLDTGSQDDTRTIAKKFDVRIENFTWCDNFSAARNQAASFATKDWILFVDGDEILETEAPEKIKQALQTDPNVAAWGIAQRNYTNDRSYPHWISRDTPNVGEISELARGIAGFSDNLMMKLYRNRLGIQWKGVIHESIVDSCRSLGLIHREVPVVILHHLNELKSESFRNEKRNYYLKLSVEKLKQDPTHENPWFEAAIAMSNVGKYREAEKAFKEALQRRPDWHEAKLFRARLLLQLDENAEAEVLLRELLSVPEYSNEAHGHLSTALLYQGHVQECEALIADAMKSGMTHLSLHVNAGTLFFEKKDYQKSRQHLEAALKINPDDAFLQDALSKTLTFLKSP